jgi:hypothetical protein
MHVTPMHACPYRAIHARIHKSIRTRIHEEMGCSQTQMEPPMCVCESRQPYMPRCTSVDTDAHFYEWPYDTRKRASAHTHAHASMESTCTLIHIHVLIHTYVDVCGARECRSRCARTHVRTRTHTRMDYTRTHKCMYMHSYIYIPTW